LTSAKADQTLEDLFKWMSFGSEKIKLWDNNGGPKALAEFLDIDLPYQSVDELKRHGWESAPKSQITQAANEMLGSSSSGDVTRAERMLESQKRAGNLPNSFFRMNPQMDMIVNVNGSCDWWIK